MLSGIGVVILGEMSAVSAVVLGHLGGIDEIGIFVIPAVAVILILRWAERRSAEKSESRDGDSGGVDASPTDH